MAWLAKLQEELRSKTYCPGPLLRVWIPKSNGGQRPLGIPAIRERVAQMALLLVIGPIFEADFCPEQYGFRPGVDAKMAIRRAYFHVAKRGLREVVDADLSDYFNTIPHGALLRCLSRRIADGQVLSTIKQWLRTPVVERTGDGERRTTEAADKNRGVPQGGPATPPTILQTAPCGTLVKRERVYPVYHADLGFVYLHPFHQCADYFPACEPVGVV